MTCQVIQHLDRDSDGNDDVGRTAQKTRTAWMTAFPTPVLSHYCCSYPTFCFVILLPVLVVAVVSNPSGKSSSSRPPASAGFLQHLRWIAWTTSASCSANIWNCFFFSNFRPSVCTLRKTVVPVDRPQSFRCSVLLGVWR